MNEDLDTAAQLVTLRDGVAGQLLTLAEAIQGLPATDSDRLNELVCFGLVMIGNTTGTLSRVFRDVIGQAAGVGEDDE